MSDHIAHLGICDDVFRLALLDPRIEPTFRSLMTSHRDSAHMGCITRYADKWTVDLVHWGAQQAALPADQRDRRWQDKVAFTLGSLTHRAADRLTKPITNCWRGATDSGPTGGDANESKIMQDLLIWREVYQHGVGPLAAPFTPEAIAAHGGDAQRAAEDYFRLMLRRALIAMHTILPDPEHIHDWMTRFFDGMQTYPKSLDQYAQLATDWDPEKVEKYLTAKRFYQHDDALIALARRIQHGGSASADEITSAHAATDQSHSRYGRALAKSLDYLIAATAWWRGEIDHDEASRRFDIGVPELSIVD